MTLIEMDKMISEFVFPENICYVSIFFAQKYDADFFTSLLHRYGYVTFRYLTNGDQEIKFYPNFKERRYLYDGRSIKNKS